MPIQQLSSFIIPVGFLVLFYFLLIRPQKRKEKEIQEMRSRLKVGDNVTTIGAITGKIVKITDDTVTIETGVEKTKITFEKWGVGKVNNEK